MQERVALALIRRVIGMGDVGIGEFLLVFRMLADPVGRNALKQCQDAALALLAPGVGEKLANFVAAGVEHGGGGACEGRFQGDILSCIAASRLSLARFGPPVFPPLIRWAPASSAGTRTAARSRNASIPARVHGIHTGRAGSASD